MKRSALMLVVMASLAVTVSCKENAALKIDDATAKKAELAHAEAGKMPVIKFETIDHDFGTIAEGQKVEYTYKFTNTGTGDLVINNAKASCGCTVPDYTKTPVGPGESGEVKVVFDSSGKGGMQQKTVTITANTEKETTLNFKANVTPRVLGGAVPANH
ncbi:hypothetical protein VF12_38325 [Nostoc linckia z15]|nr:hypothetical protein VF12_38325 [Nostoc linckia z15]